MTDSAYINQCERDPDYQEMEWSYSLAMSHAVVDSIAAELAAALRESRNLYDLSPQESVRKFEEWRWNVVEPALERFDNLTKGTE